MQRNDSLNDLHRLFVNITTKPWRMLPTLAYCVGCFLILLLMALSVSAQDFRGVLYGQVKDPSGALIPHAKVTATGPSQTYTGETSGNRELSIPFVQPGRYTVSVEAKGFKTEAQQAVFLDISQKSNLNFVLQV